MSSGSPLNPAFLACVIGCTGWVVLICHTFTTVNVIRGLIRNIFGVEVDRRGRITSAPVSDDIVAQVWFTYWLLYWGVFLLAFVLVSVLVIRIVTGGAPVTTTMP